MLEVIFFDTCSFIFRMLLIRFLPTLFSPSGVVFLIFFQMCGVNYSRQMN